MPISRIQFALNDAVKEILGLLPEGKKPSRVELRLDFDTYDAVVKQLEYHHGAKLKASDIRMVGGAAVSYAGMTIIGVPLGKD